MGFAPFIRLRMTLSFYSAADVGNDPSGRNGTAMIHLRGEPVRCTPATPAMRAQLARNTVPAQVATNPGHREAKSLRNQVATKQ